MENLVHLYMGEGKGKTTASMGLALRALGQGRKVLIAQFMKNGKTGELETLKKLDGVTIIPPLAMNKFTFQMTQDELKQAALEHGAHLEKIGQVALREKPGLVLMDELAVAVCEGLVEEEKAMALIEECVSFAEVVLTGRYAPDCIKARADYISEIVKRKHPYDKGVQARKGIEF